MPNDFESNDTPLSAQDERLLDAALGHAPAEGEGAEWAAFVTELRRDALAEVAPPSAARAAAVIDRVEEHVAQERRSTWRLLRSGLRHNALLRVAAASLVVHLAALPVLAWLHFSAVERPDVYVEFEEHLPMPVAEELPEVLAPVAVEDPKSLDQLQPDAAQDSPGEVEPQDL